MFTETTVAESLYAAVLPGTVFNAAGRGLETVNREREEFPVEPDIVLWGRILQIP